MSELEIAIFGAGRTAENIGLTIVQNSEALEKKFELVIINPNDMKKNSNRAELVAKELNQSGIPLGKDYDVKYGHENAEAPDIAVFALGRQRKEGEKRSDLFDDNSKAIFETAADYCPKNNISLADSFIIEVGNPVGSLSHVLYKGLEKSAIEEGVAANPKKIAASGTGLDTARAKEIILNGHLKKNPELKKYGLKDIEFMAGAGHDNSVVFTEEYGAIGGKPIRDVLGEETVASVCGRVKGMGAEYNKHGGVGPSVGGDVFGILESVVNNKNENTLALTPVSISSDEGLSVLGLSGKNIFDYVKKHSPENSSEKILRHMDYVWTGTNSKIGSEGVISPNIPKYGDEEKHHFEISVAETVLETMRGYYKGGVLRPFLNHEIKK
ncbi:MAG: hypothetical protein KKB25_02270 [Nanoarchaeota archaeon]|nr:hypothetical protein [Nanoarchaeota archaeon]